MPKVNTNMLVTTENDRDRQIIAAMFGDVIGILAGNNLDYNLSSYEVVDEDEELVDSDHDHSKCEKDLHKIGFAFETVPEVEDVKEYAKHMAATFVNDQTGLSYASKNFEILGIKKTDRGWIAFVKCNDRSEFRYEITRDIANEEVMIEQYVYSKVVTYTGS